MISIVCGITNPSGGTVTVGGHDVVREFRATRAMIGLVPQELTTDQFETVWNTVSFSRGLHGKKPNPAHIERVLRDLSLWEKRDNTLRQLSGGMKRRVLIAKALSHEPQILFLDEPTAGVDVTLRKDMWHVVERLRASGVTIILTTHYIEEAEEIADRVGVINDGKLLLVEEKKALMAKLGRKQLILDLLEPLDAVPHCLDGNGFIAGAEWHDVDLRLRLRARAVEHRGAAVAFGGRGHSFQGPVDAAELARRHLRIAGGRRQMNFEAVKSIYAFEMARTRRTLLQSVVSPVISTSLYFIVFGAAIGSRIQLVEGVSYGAFITPGLIMLTLLGQCISNGSFGIYFPEVHRHDL